MPGAVARGQGAVEGAEGAMMAPKKKQQFVEYRLEPTSGAPQFAKPYIETNKHDVGDSEAICEAVMRPNMRFVPKMSAVIARTGMPAC